MRILQVIGAMDRGGAETMLMNIYRSINREEIQFDFLVHEDRECDYDKEIEELGGRIFRLPRYVITNGIQYRKLCRAFFEQHSEHAVVHGHIGSSAWIYLSEAKRANRLTVLHSHSQNFMPLSERLVFNLLVKRSIKYTDEFLACSQEAGLDRFGPEIVNGSHHRVLTNGIDVSCFACDDIAHEEAKRSLGLSGSTVVGHVGRFAPEKNHDFLLHVFSEYLLLDPTAIMLLLGRGPLEQEVRSKVTELGIDERVVFCGVRDDVAKYMKAFDLFLFPSVSEGLGISVVEAQTAGVKCLASTGVPESAIISETSKRIPISLGAEEWAKTANSLVKADSVRIQGAHDAVAAGYDVKASAQILVDCYSNLIRNRKEP